MIEVRPFETLGAFDAGWLDAHYHFSFADYHDPSRMGLGPLRVWNDDRVNPGGGFPPHPHRDFEIITYVRQGAVSHEDSMGNRGRTAAGDVQVMSAGTGVVHSEFNADDEDLTLFQIWLRPDRIGLPPRWETQHFDLDNRKGSLVPLATGRAPTEGALKIHQDVVLLAGVLPSGAEARYALKSGTAYLVPARGVIEVNGHKAAARAGIIVAGEPELRIRAVDEAEVVVMDLP